MNCDKKSIVALVLPLVLGTVLIIVILIAVIVSLIISKRFKEKERKANEGKVIFKMDASDVVFDHEDGGAVFNKTELTFNTEDNQNLLKIKEETEDVICIGNNSTKTMKVQISMKDDTIKFQIRATPPIVTLKRGFACEFHVFVKPLCTCRIEDSIKVIVLNMSKGEQKEIEIPVRFETELSTLLDPDELIEEKKLGEGSFGIVFLGQFRGNRVAIKRMKGVADNEKQMEEFEKEVAMLDKFRSDVCVHFYGACFIPGKICMVTEFAQYGSLQDLMNKRKNDPIPKKMQLKLMMDVAQGIAYLHVNDILNRDIKTDNMLVITLEENVK